MSVSPRQFYTQQLEKYTQQLQVVKRKLAVSSALRLTVFLVIVAGVYVAFGNTIWILGIIAVGIGLFVLLISRHSQLQYRKELTQALLEQNTTELTVLDRAFHHLPDGSQFKDSNHAFSGDIDLFGKGSLFQYLNRTALLSGSNYLAGLLTSNNISNICQKQEAVRELAAKPEWRQRFAAVASLVKTEITAVQVGGWLSKYSSFVPKWAPKIATVFSLLSILFLVLYFLDSVSGYVVFGWFLLGVAISGAYVKKVNRLSQDTAKIQSTFEQFHKLMLEIESESFSSELLKTQQAAILSEDRKASTSLRKFAKMLDALDQRNNMLVGVIANGFFLRDLAVSHKIEGWIAAHSERVGQWFETITFFDAFTSFGNYAFNHPEHCYPSISEEAVLLEVTGAGHPLLSPETMVRNDFRIAQEEVFIVTGANMAGKSTFLRTVSLLLVMGNVGLPVCATNANYRPMKLISSMRTTDSLADEASYFFSELQRLKFIVDSIQQEPYCIILDEILKGTNSTDKAIGSRKFLERLVAGNSTGIIATHDLSLCEVANRLPEVTNYYFDAQIDDDELYFDYQLKHGVCQNMNASFLLKKMNIVE
ncbi:MAG: DNA mismatch repair protein MutS [Flavobacteriaceae bacterium]|nr:DNA mismatch repair protein MutS [Flavobacteriaceae bacterium]